MSGGRDKAFKHYLFVDFETYWDQEYSLRRLSPPEYILAPQYQTLLLAAYDVTWDAPRIVLPEDIPSFLAQYPAKETFCCSHNALFDLAILAWRYGWVAGRLSDTLGMSRSLLSLKHHKLAEVSKALFGADTKGDLVYKVKGLDAMGIKRAGLWGEFCTYALQDVRLCALIYARLEKRFPVEERQVMDLVLRAAVEPTLHADVRLLEDHLASLRRRKEGLLRDCGYDKAALMSTLQFRTALEALGVPIKMKTSPTGRWVPQFSKTDPFMGELLEYEGGPDDDVNYQVQTLAAARLSHRSTIEETRAERFVNIAKLPWQAEMDGNGRKPVSAHLLPVPLRYGGAHTHRLSGEWKLNLQNLPRDKAKSKLRQALLAPPGHQLITADLAQIEARIVAQLAGQAGLTEAFRRGDDVYAHFASVVFGRPVTKAGQPHERFLGKTAILGLGYGCGHERYHLMVTTQARQNGIPLTGIFNERIAEQTVNTYRALFPLIPQAWRKLDHYLATYINNPDQQAAGYVWGPVRFSSGTIRLPNKMTLRYALRDENQYGARLFENITQALARIVVMQAAVRLADRGLRFVLQCHDELVFVVPDVSVQESKAIVAEEMTREPDWLPGLPLAVEVGSGPHYGACK